MRLALAGYSLLAIVDVPSRLLSAMSHGRRERVLHRTDFSSVPRAPLPCRSSSPNSTRKDLDRPNALALELPPMPGR